MTYAAGEALIATTIKGHDNFDNDNTTQAKWEILDSGKDDHYCVIKHGGTRTEWISVGKVSVEHHVTIAQIWKMYEDDGTSATALYGFVEDAKTQLRNNLKLGDAAGKVQHARIEQIGEVEEMWTKGGGLAWIKQDINILWDEQVVAS